MKLFFGILFLAVFAYSEVAGQFECYKCGGEECEGTLPVVDCYTNAEVKALAYKQSKSATDLLLNKYHGLSRKRRAADDNYACYTIRYKDGNKTLKQRGCANRKTVVNPCDSVTPPANITMIVCELCSEPKCNSSAGIHLSIVAILAAMYARFFM